MIQDKNMIQDKENKDHHINKKKDIIIIIMEKELKLNLISVEDKIIV